MADGSLKLFPTTLKFELTGMRRAAILHAARELKCQIIYRRGEADKAFEIAIETAEKAFEFGWFCARDKETWPLVIDTGERSNYRELTRKPNGGGRKRKVLVN